MDFQLNEEHTALQQLARDFANEVLAPGAIERDKHETFCTEFIPQLAEMGFMGITIPEQYGGSELNNFEQVLIMEELHRVDAATGVAVSVHNSLTSSPIIHFGSEDLKQRYLPRMASAEILGAYCLSEPDYGSDAVGLRCAAREDGDHWVLNGTKAWITNGGYADFFIVFVTEDPAMRSKGISAFLVDKTLPGVTIGKKEDKLGIRASSTTQVILEDVRVPKENLLGERGKGFKIAMHTLDGGRIGIATQAVGIAQGSLDKSVAYSKERKQFGKAICEFQGIQWKLADMATEIEAARLLTYKAAMMRDGGERCSQLASMAKLFASETANRAAKEAIQIHGGSGYVAEYEVERYFRDAKITEIYEGTSEIQRLVIARSLLG